MSFFVDQGNLHYLADKTGSVFMLETEEFEDPYEWKWIQLSGDRAKMVRDRHLAEQIIGPPIWDFNNSALTPMGLSKILRTLDDCGQVHIRRVAPGTLDLLALAGAFMVFHRKDVMHMVGEQAGARVRSISALWVSLKGRIFRRTAYRHKLLRHEVVVYEPEHDWIPPIDRTDALELNHWGRT